MKPKSLLFLSIIIFAFLGGVIGCEGDLSSEDLLIGSWTNSYEEQEAESGILIYRPTNFKEYSPSWYRNTFSLNSDGTCEYLVLAANDGHFFEKGIWNYDENTNILTITYTRREMAPHLPSEDIAHKYEVIELGKNILKLKSIS